MSEPSPSDGKSNEVGKPVQKWRLYFRILAYFVIVGALFILLMCASVPLGGERRTVESRGLQTAHVLALAMFQYANDNNQKYPDGKSSTEIFQKLIDAGYISNPSIFYIPMAGKIEPVDGQPLKPENVCWDVTRPEDDSSPDGLPVVFSTGYKVNCVPGGAAVPLVKPYPKYEYPPVPNRREFWEIFWGESPPSDTMLGIAVCYKNNSASFLHFQPTSSQNSNFSIPNFVPADFDPKGKNYRQLTPDGVLSEK